MVFTCRMVPEVVQPFRAALQRGEFITGAAEGVGTYREKGARDHRLCGSGVTTTCPANRAATRSLTNTADEDPA